MMTEQQVEIASFDLRYQGYRMQDRHIEKQLLQGILENGIQDPLQGVGTDNPRILLNGFKRFRCAQKLGINIVPYHSLADDEAFGILQLLRTANAKNLTILEQAKLIDELKTTHGLNNAEIAKTLEKSKGWVSMRTDILAQIPPDVMQKIMSGAFPAYSYLYTLRPFMRMNGVNPKEIETFVKSVSGQGLSTRNIQTLADAYFKGSEELRQQISNGHVSWALNQLKQQIVATPDCNQVEQTLLRDLTILQKYMHKIISKSDQHQRDKSLAFYAQANLLTAGILKNMDLFSKTVKDFHDQSRQTAGDLPAASGRHDE